MLLSFFFYASIFALSRSITFFEYLFDSGSPPSQLSHSRQIYFEEISIHRQAFSQLINHSIIIIPSDKAWNRHQLWFEVLQQYPILRKRVTLSSITTPARLFRFTNGNRFARGLSSVSVTFALFDLPSDQLLIHPRDSESSSLIKPHLSHICLVQHFQAIDPPLGPCCKVEGPFLYSDTIVYLSEIVLVRDDIKKELEKKAEEIMKKKRFVDFDQTKKKEIIEKNYKQIIANITSST